jgi:predicted ribonuclease YlaK
MSFNFYDTSSLLLLVDTLFEKEENIIISSITLEELENIKTSNNKDADIKLAARKLLHKLNNNTDKYYIHIFTMDMLIPITARGLSISNDTKILACAIDYDTKVHPDETVFVTNDLALKQIANLFFG